MKLASAVILTVLHYGLIAIGFSLEKSRGFAKIEPEVEHVREVDNNTNIIQGGNNWKTKEMEEISQSERSENLKQNDPWMRIRHQTIPDLFYDYVEMSRRHLKEIEVEKIARENKKLENIFGVDEDVEGVGAEHGVRFRRRRSPDADGDWIKDFANKSELRDYENALSNEATSSTKTKKYSSTLSDPFIGNRSSFEGKDGTFQGNPKRIFNPARQGYNLRNVNYEPELVNFEISTTGEQKHISEIKAEVTKLQNLVQILRDQQYILRLLDEVNSQHVTSQTDDLDEQEVHTFTTNEIENKANNDESIFKMNDVNFSKNRFHAVENELNILKLKINELNNFVKTGIMDKIDNEIISRHSMAIRFKQELKKQKDELLNTKRQSFQILKKLLKNDKLSISNPKSSEMDEKSTEFNIILTELKALEKNISRMLTVNSSDARNEFVGKSRSENSFETSVEDPLSLQTRANLDIDTDEGTDTELDDLLEALNENVPRKQLKQTKLEKLLKELHNSNSRDPFEILLEELDAKDSSESDEQISEALLGLVKLLRKNSKSQRKENRILNNLRKTLQNKRNGSKIDKKELAKLLETILNKPESKSIDTSLENTDITANLKELAEEIEKLRDNDGTISEENRNDDSRNFEILLQKLVNNSKNTNVVTPKPKLSKVEMSALIKKLSTMVNEDNINDNEGLNDKIIYNNLPFTGTYKCEKIIRHPVVYNQYDDVHYLSPTYGDSPATDQKFQQQYKSYLSYSSPDVIYNNNYNPNNYQPDPHKLFRDYKDEYIQQPDSFQMLPNPPQNQYNFDTSYAPKYPPNTSTITSDYANEKIIDLTNQINNLKAIITNLNPPEYTQKEEDMRTLANLNQQIDALKNVIYNLAHEDNYNSDANYQTNELYNDRTSLVQNPIKYQETEKFFPSSIQTPSNVNTGQISKLQNQRMVPSASSYNPLTKLTMKNKDLIKNKNESNGRSNAIDNTNSDRRKRSVNENDSKALSELLVRILNDGLKDDENFQEVNAGAEGLDNEEEDEEIPLEDFARTVSFGQERGMKKSNKRIKKLNIFDKIFDKILDKIIDKIQIAIPRIFERLFGLDTFFKNTNLYPNYQYNYNLVQMFRSFGVGGYIPLIILKSLYTLSSLVYELQRYPFLRNFLVPGGVIALVAGLIVFLIYWFQPNYYGQTYSTYQIQPYNSYNEKQNSYHNTNYYGQEQAHSTYQIPPYNSYHNYKHSYPNTNLYSNDNSKAYPVNYYKTKHPLTAYRSTYYRNMFPKYNYDNRYKIYR